jgi:hypothetical protein
MKVICKYCGKEAEIEELELDENDRPRWCPECERDDWYDMREAALIYAEKICISEYQVQGQWLEYWTVIPGEGFQFVRVNLITNEEFRDGIVFWKSTEQFPVPLFLKKTDGGVIYNYCG